MIVEIFLDRVDGGLAVQGIEDGFDQQHVDAALDEPVDGLGIGSYETVEAGFAGRLGGRRVGGRAGQFRGFDVELVRQVLEPVIGLGNGRRIEGVGLDDVGPGVEKTAMDVGDDPGPGDRQQVVVALQVRGMVGEPPAPEISFFELVLLDHGAHGAVEHQDAFLEQGGKGGGHGSQAPSLARTPRMWQMAYTRSARFMV